MTTKVAGAGHGLLRSSAVVAVGTGLSRATGLARTMAITYAIGGQLLGSTFNLANNTPNVLYDLVLGGVLTATLVPIIVDRLHHDDERSLDALATVITLVLVAVTAVGMALSPAIIGLYTAFSDDPAEAQRQSAVAVPLLVMFMPQVLFYGLTALWTAILNAKRSFAVPAAAPVLNNVVVIALFLALPRVAGGPVDFERIADDRGLLALIGLGTTAGIVAMTLVLWPAMRHAGIRLHWNPDWRNPALRTVARLAGWTLGYVAANQAVFVVMLTLLNGLPGDQAVAAYTNAWQFFQLPVGLFTVSVMTTFTPELASLASRGTLGAFRERFGQGLRLTMLVVLPTAALLATLAAPAVALLLERGQFNASDTAVTSSALAWLAVGLPGFATFLYAMRGFYAFRDTRTPFAINLVENVVQVVLSFALVGHFGLQGVMAAFSVSYTLAAVLALAVLARRHGGLGGVGVLASLGRQLVAAGATAVAVLLVAGALGDGGRTGAVVDVVAGTGVGLVVYLGVLVVLRSDDLSLLRALRRRPVAEPDRAPLP